MKKSLFVLLMGMMLFSIKFYGQNIGAEVQDDVLKVWTDTIPWQGQLRAHWGNQSQSDILGQMESDTMYFDLPSCDSFNVWFMYFQTVGNNVYSYSTDSEKVYPEPCTQTPGPANISYQYDHVYSPPGWIYVVERFGELVFQSETTGEIFIDPNLFVSGFYYINFWSINEQKCWTRVE